MMLQKTQLIFCKIMHAIWSDVVEYADMLGFEAPMDLFDMYSEIVHIGACSIIHVELMADMDEGEYSNEEIREILNEYLNIVLMPESEIQPYSNGEEIVESLYLHSVRHDVEKGCMNLDFLYINNEEAFRLYKGDMKWMEKK